MSIIDKLDKKISDKKIKNKLKEEEEKLEAKRIKKLFKSIQDFCTEVYKKHLADDFKRLEKLFINTRKIRELLRFILLMMDFCQT